jgi:large subunit ribosomal protein L23
MILIRPILSEKSVKTAEHAKHPRYSFQVHADANKSDVAEEVEHIYNVKVADVKTMVVRGKRSNRYTKKGMTSGKAANTKKAIVTLKEGFSIDIYQTL